MWNPALGDDSYVYAYQASTRHTQMSAFMALCFGPLTVCFPCQIKAADDLHSAFVFWMTYYS